MMMQTDGLGFVKKRVLDVIVTRSAVQHVDLDCLLPRTVTSVCVRLEGYKSSRAETQRASMMEAIFS